MSRPPDATGVPEDDPWMPPRRSPLRKAGLTVLMIALGVAPGLALMATDPLGDQFEERAVEAPPPTDDAAAPFPTDDPPAKAPAAAESPAPAAPSKPLVDLEWPEDEPDGLTDDVGSEPVERWYPDNPGQGEPIERWTPGAAPGAEAPEAEERHCLLICLG